MLPGKRDALGRLYVVGGPVVATDTYQGGIAISALGQVRYTTGTPNVYTNGFGTDHTGRLCVGSGPAVVHLEGIPRIATGNVRYQLDTAPAATDPYLGGLRVGPTGGVYMTTSAPP